MVVIVAGQLLSCFDNMLGMGFFFLCGLLFVRLVVFKQIYLNKELNVQIVFLPISVKYCFCFKQVICLNPTYIRETIIL